LTADGVDNAANADGNGSEDHASNRVVQKRAEKESGSPAHKA